jgi:hypothetical protein
MLDTDSELRLVKDRIATVYARREQWKQALERGVVAPRVGFTQLEETDRELSGLDSRYKQLWDAARRGLEES